MTLLSTLLLLLPAAAANIAPVLSAHMPFLAFPVDGGKTFRGRRITGDHKTVRGFFFGCIAAIAVALILATYAQGMMPESFVLHPILSGFLLGFGALAGDSVKSFLKRQSNIPPGSSWIPFDQVDWIIGACIAISFIVPLSFITIVILLVVFGIAHPLVNILGKLLGLKKNWL